MKSARTLTPDETWLWLKDRLQALQIGSLDQLSEICGINKGTLSKYFHQVQRPNVGALEPLCVALQVSPQTLLIALGVFTDSATNK
jgi:transcriptional regulator with XRE-family HTH domain